MSECNKRVILDLLYSIYYGIEDERLLDKLSEVMEIIQNMEDAIPIGFIEERIYNLRKYSPADYLTDLINDWDGSEGYIWRVNHGE